MKMSITTVVTAASIFVSAINGQLIDPLLSILDTEDSNAYLNFTQLAAQYGHPAEEYDVYTEDGYRLKVFRLKGEGCGLPILLFHGILDSSDTWIIRGEKSLAITLAKLGCDVWLGNVRGNKYSQGHISLNSDANSTYWNFTFHDHGVHDLPATIDLVLKKTGASKLNSIGHSQGTTIHFVLLSTKPEYNDRVNVFIALAPVAYLNHSPPPLSTLLHSLPEIYESLTSLQQYAVFSDTSPEEAVVQTLCTTPITAYIECVEGILYEYCGYDSSQIDPNFSVVVFKHAPTATSAKNILHYGQVAIRKKFAQFDYGKAGNLVAYNASEPPQYKLENVSSKVVLLTARNDYFSVQADVAILRRQLPNVVRFVINPRRQMNHLDYIWGEDMRTYLFPYIIDSLITYGEL